MIITVAKLRELAPGLADVGDETLQVQLEALESLIRKYTNNNFQKRNIRTVGSIIGGTLVINYPLIKKDDTVEISKSKYNDGLYVIGSDTELYDEENVLVTKVEYPSDVQLATVNIIEWKLKNKAANSGENSKKEIQSETISRHSVTYATDATESDLDERYGAPRKYTAPLKQYVKARF